MLVGQKRFVKKQTFSNTVIVAKNRLNPEKQKKQNTTRVEGGSCIEDAVNNELSGFQD